MFFVAIPSYSRHHQIIKSSLALCSSWGIKHNHIFVFVVNEQYHLYSKTLQTHNYHNVNIICGPLGLNHMRNFILNFFTDDLPVLHMDDDIDDLCIMKENTEFPINNSKRYPLQSLDCSFAIQFINDAFLYTKNIGASLFGIYPVRNGFFMKDLPEITTDLRFCVGAFWGLWNRKDIQIHLEEKEDFERTLLAFEKDNKVVRFNRVCPKTKYYKTSGGMQDRNIDRKQLSVQACEYLCTRWPKLCRIYKSKKNGMCEVRLSTPNPEKIITN